MKKLFALLLAAVLCLSLAACGDGKVETNADNSQEQNTENTPNESEQVETEPQEQTIEITLDNWQEYFEIKDYLGVIYDTNAFDEVTDSVLTFYTILESKEEYSDYVADVAVEYSMDFYGSDIVYNLDDFSFELIDSVSHPDRTVDESRFVRGETDTMNDPIAIPRFKIVDGKAVGDSIYYNLGSPYRSAMSFYCNYIEKNDDGTGYIYYCPANIQITRIEGTLEYTD